MVDKIPIGWLNLFTDMIEDDKKKCKGKGVPLPSCGSGNGVS